VPDLRGWILDDFGLDVTELTQIHHGVLGPDGLAAQGLG
jgi:hypothetical protein